MKPQARIYVAGHTGLAGSALVRALKAAGYTNLIVRRHADLDLTDSHAIASFFALEKPEIVFLAAAKVGGILVNQTYPADFIQDNLAIQTNVIHEAWRAGVRRLLFLGSSCIYPRQCPQPIREDYLMTGPLEPTNRPYALAKIAGIEMCWAYNRQHETRYLCAMPTNLYGPGDNYDLRTGHVLAAFMRRFHDAKASGANSVTLWGTGAARREFLHSDDMAAACVHLMTLPEVRSEALYTDREPPLVNVGCGEDLTIRELAELVRRVVDVDVDIEWDSTKPDGMPRKLLDVGKLSGLGWQASIELENGIRHAYADFCSRA